MSNVFNWQLGREMVFPYKAAYPDQQFAFVFNLNRCIGCQSCTMACKSTWTFSKGQEAMWWNNVETKPYGGYPHHWDVKTLDLLEPFTIQAQPREGEPLALGNAGERHVDRPVDAGGVAVALERQADRASDDPG